MRVLVLHERVQDQARTDELDVLVQAGCVRDALTRLGHETQTLELDLDLAAAARDLRDGRPDLVFNLVESIEGQGRLIHLAPSLLESLRLPFTGSGSTAMLLSSGKLPSKRLLALAGLPTPSWLSAAELFGERAVALVGEASTWIVKSAWEHGSVGLEEDCVIEAAAGEKGVATLREAFEHALPRLGGEAFVERYVEGRELNAALLPGLNGPRLLPVAEILFQGDWSGKRRMVGWKAKWDSESFECVNTPRRFDLPLEDAALLREVMSLSLSCYELFDLAGHVRVDFRIDAAGRPFVLELNASPCLSPDAGFAAALAREGLSLDEAVSALLDDALRRHGSRRGALARFQRPGHDGHAGKRFEEAGK